MTDDRIRTLAREMSDHFNRQTEAALRLVLQQWCGTDEPGALTAHRLEAVFCNVTGVGTYRIDGADVLRTHRPQLVLRDGAHDVAQVVEFLTTSPEDGPRYVVAENGKPRPYDGGVPAGRVLVGTKNQLLAMAGWLNGEDFQ